jgi:hypothetical protein
MNTIPIGIAVMFAIVMMGVAHAQIDPPRQVPEERNRLEAGSNVIQVFGQGSATFRQQSERFSDPRQRAAVRAEQRAQIAESHQDIRALLQIDRATERKLIDLLADQQTEDLEQFYITAAGQSSQGDPWERMNARAQRETAKVQALRDLLGQEKLERYQAFARHVNDYRQVAKLDARLAPPDRLNLDQKQRLAELWGEQIRNEIGMGPFSRRSGSLFGFAPGQQLPSPEEMQRQNQLMTLTSNEENWRRMPLADAELRGRAAGFLTPAQLDALAQMNAERAENLRQWIEDARVKMGLSPQIPDEAEPTESPRPALRTGSVKLAVKLTINGGEATHYTDTVRNGESVTFRCAEGLLVEVRPTMYEDDAFDVRVLYYEPDGRGGRRLIGEGGQMGTYIPGNQSNGFGGSVITGNQGYAIQLSTQVEPG